LRRQLAAALVAHTAVVLGAGKAVAAAPVVLVRSTADAVLPTAQRNVKEHLNVPQESDPAVGTCSESFRTAVRLTPTRKMGTPSSDTSHLGEDRIARNIVCMGCLVLS
jgi:hypothetical protein